MTVTKLQMRRVEKPWGRTSLWPAFDPVAEGGAPVGEIWFQTPDGGEAELLVKYLFTSEKLSIQVHPDDEAARQRGYPRGKDEAWVVLDAEPDATIAIGTRTVMTRDQLREAAMNGSIEDMVSWRAVKAGDVFYSPAGTVHAIGAGLTLIEVQQNVDLTYRLWDYGRPRELHLDDGIAVSDPVPYVAPNVPWTLDDGRTILCDGGKFVLERWREPGEGALRHDGGPLWLIPMIGSGRVGDVAVDAGEVLLVEGDADFTFAAGTDLLVAYAGAEVNRALCLR